MDANITHGAALLFAGTFPPPDGLRARTASKRRLKSRQGAAFPRRFIRLSSALAQRSAHPFPLTHVSLFAGWLTWPDRRRSTTSSRTTSRTSTARRSRGAARTSNLSLLSNHAHPLPTSIAHLLTCPSCGTRNPPPLCIFAATGRHYRSWSTAADFQALWRRFSSCRSPRTPPPRAHGSLRPPLFYETADACFWWWSHEPATWGDVCHCPCLT